MWGDDDALEAWFRDVKKKRSGSDGAAMEEIPEAREMQSNSLVDELMGRKRGR